MNEVDTQHLQTLPADRAMILREYQQIIRRRLARPGDLQRLADLSALLARSEDQLASDAREFGGMVLEPFYGRKARR